MKGLKVTAILFSLLGVILMIAAVFLPYVSIPMLGLLESFLSLFNISLAALKVGGEIYIALFVLFCIMAVFTLLALILAIARKPVGLLIFVIFAGVLDLVIIALMYNQFFSQKIVPDGIGMILHIVGFVIAFIGSILMLIWKSKEKRLARKEISQ